MKRSKIAGFDLHYEGDYVTYVNDRNDENYRQAFIYKKAKDSGLVRVYKIKASTLQSGYSRGLYYFR